MAWSSLAPDPAKSVKANQPIIAANTVYTEITLGGVANGSANSTSTKDHYWNIDSNFDGRHRYINSPAYTTSSAGAVDPVIGAGMDCVLYAKRKTVAEAAAQQDVQWFLKNTSSQVMQMLGIRACMLFQWNAIDPTAPTVLYAHNCTLDASALHAGTSTNIFSINFTTTLPSANYLAFGGAANSGSLYLSVVPYNGATLGDIKTTTFMKFMITSVSGNYTPFQVWAFCFGG